MFVNKSAIFFKVVFKFKFGFPYVLLVTVPTLYHVDNVFEVAVNVTINNVTITITNPVELNLYCMRSTFTFG